MGIYVKDIELPKEPDEMIELAIFGDGRTVKTGESWRSPVDGKCYYGPSEDMNTYFALTVPPHGRLIDADEISEHKYATLPPYRKEYADGKPKSEEEVIAFKFGWNNAIDAITENAPTVIEAEEGE